MLRNVISPIFESAIYRAIKSVFDRVTYGSVAFTPADLFTGGYIGAWYDPSDLSTMFQDWQGQSPITADGQSVKLILDKSQGLALGPEVITNAADRDFSSDTGFWSKEGLATISGGVVNINNVAGTAAIYQFNFAAGESGGLFEIAFDLSLTSGTLDIVFSNDGYATASITTSGRKVFRIFRTNYTTFGIRAVTDATGTIDNLTIKRVLGNHAFQATAASRPLYKTSAGKHWLEFDGVDDSLSTGSIDFTASDKMSVFNGISRNNTTASIICELSDESGNVARGAFYQTSGLDIGGYYGAFGKGIISSSPLQCAIWAPDNGAESAVITGLHDIAGDLSRIRRNGTYGTDATGDKGTGNFGNYPLYIGARGGSSVFFNGKIYQLVVVGKTASGTEITDTETFINNKTGAY